MVGLDPMTDMDAEILAHHIASEVVRRIRFDEPVRFGRDSLYNLVREVGIDIIEAVEKEKANA